MQSLDKNPEAWLSKFKVLICGFLLHYQLSLSCYVFDDFLHFSEYVLINFACRPYVPSPIDL